MVDDQKTIKQILSQAENIYSFEDDEQVMLVYEDDKLIADFADFAGLVHKPVIDVKHIIYIESLHAWEVFWKV